MPTPVRRILALTVTFSLAFAIALLCFNHELLLPIERPITLTKESQSFAQLNFFGRVCKIDLRIVRELVAHLRAAATLAFSLYLPGQGLID